MRLHSGSRAMPCRRRRSLTIAKGYAIHDCVRVGGKTMYSLYKPYRRDPTRQICHGHRRRPSRQLPPIGQYRVKITYHPIHIDRTYPFVSRHLLRRFCRRCFFATSRRPPYPRTSIRRSAAMLNSLVSTKAPQRCGQFTHANR